MPGSDVLLTFAEIGVALAGLGSLVAVFLQRGDRAGALDMPRLWLVLEFSLALTVFSVLPFPIHRLGFSDDFAFRISGVCVAVFLAGHMAWSVYFRVARPDLAPNFPLALAAFLMLGHLGSALLLITLLLTSGIATAGAYLVGTSWLLVAAIINFVRLVWVMAPR